MIICYSNFREKQPVKSDVKKYHRMNIIIESKSSTYVLGSVLETVKTIIDNFLSKLMIIS